MGSLREATTDLRIQNTSVSEGENLQPVCVASDGIWDRDVAANYVSRQKAQLICHTAGNEESNARYLLT